MVVLCLALTTTKAEKNTEVLENRRKPTQKRIIEQPTPKDQVYENTVQLKEASQPVTNRHAFDLNKKINRLIEIEGGYNPSDPSKYGITQTFFKKYASANFTSTQSITKQEAHTAYINYYHALGIDQIQNKKIAWLIFDGMVNMPTTQRRLLSVILGIKDERCICVPDHFIAAINKAKNNNKLYNQIKNIRKDYFLHRAGKQTAHTDLFSSFGWNSHKDGKKWLNGWLRRLEEV